MKASLLKLCFLTAALLYSVNSDALIYDYSGNLLSGSYTDYRHANEPTVFPGIKATIVLPDNIGEGRFDFQAASIWWQISVYGVTAKKEYGTPVDGWIEIDSASNVVNWNISYVQSTHWPPGWGVRHEITTTPTSDSGLLSTSGVGIEGYFSTRYAIGSNSNSPGAWSASPIPEPTNLLMYATGLLLLASVRRKAQRT